MYENFSANRRQLAIFKKNTKMVEHYQTRIPYDLYAFCRKCFLYRSSDREISYDFQQNDEQPEKMHQFVDLFELNFFNNIYIFFDLYLFGLIFLILIIVIIFFHTFFKKLKINKNLRLK